MKKIAFLFIVLIVAVSCSSVKVSSDFDKSASFASYKTYSFTDEALTIPLDDLNKNRLIDAITSELTAKGFTKQDANPDVLININIKGEKKQTATATSTGYGYGAGYRYGGWGGYGGGTTYVSYDSYTDGTLFIDMIDASKKQLVWQGRGTKTIDPDASQEKREKNIAYAVKQIFMSYPPKF
jgi:hypothetical protein